MKENRAFRILFFLQKNRQALHGTFLKPQYKMYRVPQSYISMHPVSDVPSFSKISQLPGYKQQNGKQCFLQPLSFKISLKDTSFHISLNFLGLDLSTECLLRRSG